MENAANIMAVTAVALFDAITWPTDKKTDLKLFHFQPT